MICYLSCHLNVFSLPGRPYVTSGCFICDVFDHTSLLVATFRDGGCCSICHFLQGSCACVRTYLAVPKLLAEFLAASESREITHCASTNILNYPPQDVDMNPRPPSLSPFLVDANYSCCARREKIYFFFSGVLGECTPANRDCLAHAAKIGAVGMYMYV